MTTTTTTMRKARSQETVKVVARRSALLARLPRLSFLLSPGRADTALLTCIGLCSWARSFNASGGMSVPMMWSTEATFCA